MHWLKFRNSRPAEEMKMLLSNCRPAARRALVALVAVPLVLGGCNDSTGPVCTDELVFGILGTAVDAETNANITSGAFLIASAGTYRDSVGVNANGQLAAAAEQPGTFMITIGHPGYFSFVRNNVVVAHDGCHVIPVTLQATLTSSPEGKQP